MRWLLPVCLVRKPGLYRRKTHSPNAPLTSQQKPSGSSFYSCMAVFHRSIRLTTAQLSSEIPANLIPAKNRALFPAPQATLWHHLTVSSSTANAANGLLISSRILPQCRMSFVSLSRCTARILVTALLCLNFTLDRILLFAHQWVRGSTMVWDLKTKTSLATSHSNPPVHTVE